MRQLPLINRQLPLQLTKVDPNCENIVENIRFVARALKYATRDMINFAQESTQWLTDFQIGIKQADSVITFVKEESEERITRFKERVEYYHQLHYSEKIEFREIELSRRFINTEFSVK